MNPHAAQSYLRTRVLTATPEQLQMMLYDGAIRFTELARTALEKREYETTYTNISRAQKIITELNCSLKHELAPDLCGKLASLYNFIYRKLIEASTQHHVAPIDEALTLLRFQRDTWALLLEKLSHEKAKNHAAGLDLPAPNARMEATISMQG
jgi:flagellar protein FliS